MFDLPQLAGRTLPAFPCDWHSKRPTTPRGFHDAVADPTEFAALQTRYGGQLIGVPTGEPSDVDVLDCDPQGLDWLRQHERELPVTRLHKTRRGLHLLFRRRGGLRCSASVIARGVDVRTDGGYVIWWPSHGGAVAHADTVAEWPAWLLDLIATHDRARDLALPIHQYRSADLAGMRDALARHPRTVPADSKAAAYAAGALNRAFAAVASMRPPGRGSAVEREAYRLGGLAGAGWIAAADVFEVLMVACEENRLVRADGRWSVERQILRSLLNGTARPRHPQLAA